MPPDRLFSTIFSIAAGLWGLSEIIISRRLRSKGAGSQRDSGTARIVYMAGFIGVPLAMAIAIHDDGYMARFTPLGVLGLAMLVIGVVFRAWAIRTLRRFFTVDVTVFDDHRIIRTGPYRYLRHPSYTGALLSFYGVGIGFENLWAGLVISVLPTVAFFIRMRVEEAALRDAFPNDYPDYERSTKRLIPFVY
jgi:protein-S-isoprenylcysteine O-methyltransferase